MLFDFKHPTLRDFMTNHATPCGCACCGPSRRVFLAAGCAACASGLLSVGNIAFGAQTSEKMRVRVFFILIDEVMPAAGWPNIGYDYRPGMEDIKNGLTNGCPDIEFAYSMAQQPAKVQEIMDADADNVDGYIVVQMMCKGSNAINTVVKSGKPVLFTDFLYCGSAPFLGHTAHHLRAGTPNFAFMSSNRTSDLVEAARCFTLAGKEGNLKAFVDGVTKVRHKQAPATIDFSCAEDKLDLLSPSEVREALKGMKILVYNNAPMTDERLKQTLGIEIVSLPFEELNDEWGKADKDQAQEIVKKWKSTAASIIDISDETLEKSARMYLAQKSCLKRHEATAFTMNCLGGFYGGHVQAYPCLGYHELQNEGRFGACECDIRSIVTMLITTTMTKGRPGFISDPVIDTAARQIIYAHCVASNKPFGPAGPTNPFTILTHSEDRQGASVRSTLPPGYMTTTLEMAHAKKEILFHQAKAVGNSADDRACRTKLVATPIGDMDKLLTEWDRWGWHRVTFYGDLKEAVFALADAFEWKVVEEA